MINKTFARSSHLFIFGLILIIFSVTFFPVKIERISKKYYEQLTENRKNSAREHFQTIKHNLLNEEVENLSLNVDELNQKLNNAITKSNETNEAMTNLLIEAEGKKQLLDSLQRMYDNEILTYEKEVDSLNSLFRKNSNLLIDQMKTFNKSDLDLKLTRAGTRYQDKFILSHKVLFFSYLLFFLFCLANGVYLFYKGLIQFKKDGQNNNEEFINISDDS